MSSPVASHLEPWSELNDKVVLVTGASSGIGREFCSDLAEAGCKIVAAARRVCDEINDLRGDSDDCNALSELRALPVELDVTSDGASIEAAVKKAWDAFGRIDVLIHNAGIRVRVHTLFDLTEEEWNNTIKTNLTISPLLLIWNADTCLEASSMLLQKLL